MKWRVLKLGSFSCYENMAIDEAISNGISEKISEPTIRFYKWNPSAVSIGRFQSMEEEVNIINCNNSGIEYVRRITGGGAVFHDSDGELTYSIIGNEELFSKGIRESYKEICSYLIEGLNNLGVRSTFVPINDIIVGNKKISGNAQSRKNGVVLQHGTILYKLNLLKMFSLLNVSKEKISDKMITNVEDRVTSVTNENPNITFDNLYESILNSFTKNKETYFGKLNEQEEKETKELIKKYKSKEWNFYR
ncbi:MAG: biotin/lipoate A/B protein ligase family protein [Candidatus Micrarchaeaceae archaeon]